MTDQHASGFKLVAVWVSIFVVSAGVLVGIVWLLVKFPALVLVLIIAAVWIVLDRWESHE